MAEEQPAGAGDREGDGEEVVEQGAEEVAEAVALDVGEPRLARDVAGGGERRDADPAGDGPIPDLGSRALDAFVRASRRLARSERTALRRRVGDGLDRMEAVFVSADPLLARQSAVPLEYLFVRALARGPSATFRKSTSFSFSQ